ncbi:MAG: substrate-binding domain-containing protein [Ilumatobacteraceae bacterium]
MEHISVKTSTKRFAAAAITASLVLAACGGDDEPAAEEPAAEEPAADEPAADEPAADEPAAEEPAAEEPAGDDLSALSGSVFVSGSSTVEPISIAVGDAFGDLAPNVAITVEGPGTGDGFAKFCAGETDISDASRPIKGSEAETCAANGIEFIELKVAVDGLSVITSRRTPPSSACRSSTSTPCSARTPSASTTGPTLRRSPTATPPR